MSIPQKPTTRTAMIVVLLFTILWSLLGHDLRSVKATEWTEQTLVEENFDGYASRSELPTTSMLPVWWNFSTPANTSVTLDAYALSSPNKYLKINDTGTNTAYAQLNFGSLSSGKAIVQFNIKTEADPDPTLKHEYFGATLYSSQNEVITQIQNSTLASGYIFKMLQKNAAGQTVSTPMLPTGSYTDGAWYQIRLEVDFAQKKVKGYCYDLTGTTLLGTVDYEGFQIPEATHISAIKFVSTSSGRGVLGIDNVKVTSFTTDENPGTPSVEHITVDVATVLSDVYNKPLGVVANHTVDSDVYHPNRGNTFVESLQALGAGTVRFGEGEASDRYLWTGAPYPTTSESPLHPQLSYYYSTGHVLSNSERALLNPDGTYKETQDFNEFMHAVNETGVQPFVIVGLDAMKATGADWAKTKEELKTAAVEWVRYANVINSWNVKYWEIGNEPFYTSQSGYIWSPQDYADVFNEFTAAMKAVDPSIQVGVPVYDSVSWNSVVMPAVSSQADFVAVHLYGTTNVSPIDTVINHINQYFNSSDRDRIKISITETNTYTAGSPLPNDISRATLLAIKIGKILQYDKVDYIHFWVTRKGLNNEPTDERSAIDEDGKLLPMGKAIQVWNRFLLEKMVSTTGASQLSTFSSYSPSSQKLSVYLMNSNTNSITVNLNLQNYTVGADTERWVLKGTSATDTNPILAEAEPITYADGSASFVLDPSSVTVITFAPSTSK